MLGTKPLLGNLTVYGIPLEDTMEALKKIGVSNKKLEHMGIICQKLKNGQLNLKGVIKLSEQENFKLLKLEWDYSLTSQDPQMELQRFRLTAETFSRRRETRISSIIMQIAEITNIDLLFVVTGSIHARRADHYSDVDLKFVVRNQEDIPKLKLLMPLATYLSGEVLCPAAITAEGIRGMDDLYMRATYTRANLPFILSLVRGEPCWTTSEDFLREVENTIRSGVRKFYTHSSLLKETLSGLKEYGLSYREVIYDEGKEFRFRDLLKLLDLALKYKCFKRDGLFCAADTFWKRMATIPKTSDYIELVSNLGSLLIDVGGNPAGNLENRRMVEVLIKKYCKHLK